MVYDPFSGSGVVASACKSLNRNFIGTELNEQYYKESIVRIKMVNMNELRKKFVILECSDVSMRDDKMPFKQYVEIELKRLIDTKKIPAKVTIYCDRHYSNFEVEPLSIMGNKVIYKQCPRCDIEIEKAHNGFVSEEERNKKSLIEYEKMVDMLIKRGVPKRFFTINVDYSKGLFVNFHHLLRGQLFKNLIIGGGIGSGKSTFVYEMCKIYYTLNKIAVVTNASYLVSTFKKKYSNISEVLNDYKETDCLCIDEIDNLDLIDFKLFDDLIEYFYSNIKRLVFIGNIDIELFKSSLSPKSLSRLKNNTSIINAGNINLREEFENDNKGI